jgi:hypothetical protein
MNYPQVEDTYAVSSMKSLSLMETDPPILPPSPPLDNPSPILGWVLGFDSVADIAPLQACRHPRVEDTCLMEIRPDHDDHMVDVPRSDGLGTSVDPTGIVAALRNSSLDICKEGFPPRGPFHDDDDDRDQECGEGGQMGDHARVTVGDSGGASSNPLSDSRDHSGHSGNEPVAEKEGNMEGDLVDYESDPYKSAMRNQLEAANDFVFRVKCHSRDPNTPEDKVCFLRFFLYYIWFFFSGLVFLEARILVLIWPFP